MSVNAIEPADAQPVAQTQNSELIYRLEDRPPLPQTLFAACQHLLAMFVAVITPALLICQALGLPAQDTQHIISMSLFASGVASIIQIKAWGPVGSGLLSIQGTSFNFVAPLIMCCVSCAGKPNAWQINSAGVITATNMASRC
ncbi:solute carrier family 23 protein [Salmonella enterica]|uniref:solute carrier family 23 protein n=1 Tax=Salmonella enterica TaxID=28901 RepID=UPI001F2777AF|nr:solute carrier family 23 protein [Salmonella enterica]